MNIPNPSKKRLIKLEKDMKRYCEWSHTEDVAELYGNLYSVLKKFLDKNGIQR